MEGIVMDYTEIAPEGYQENTVACTSLQTAEGVYSIFTSDLSRLPPGIDALLARAVTILADCKMGHPEQSDLNFETMLFFDGEPADYPFGAMPGNEIQGVYQRYATEEEALAGHRTFIEQVQGVLREMVATP